MKNNTLKQLAMRAKNRMMNRSGVDKLDAHIKIISRDDEEFVDRVRHILAEEEDVRNPLKLLMDEKQINKLDEKGRERYLLETMDKYLKAKAQIEEEQRRA